MNDTLQLDTDTQSLILDLFTRTEKVMNHSRLLDEHVLFQEDIDYILLQIKTLKGVLDV